MKNKPLNVEAALSHAIKVEAYELSLACSGIRLAGAGSYPERRPRNAYAVMDQEGSGQESGRAVSSTYSGHQKYCGLSNGFGEE